LGCTSPMRMRFFAFAHPWKWENLEPLINGLMLVTDKRCLLFSLSCWHVLCLLCVCL
jgi:hypothetical protein